MSRVRVRASTYALVGSVAVHGAVALWLATRPAPPARERPVTPVVEFEFLASSALVPAPEEALVQEALVQEAPAPDELRRQARERVAQTRPAEAAIASAESSANTTHSAESASATSAPVSATVSIEAPSNEPAPSRAKPLDLSPLAAALTMRASLLSPNSCGAALAGAAADCGGTQADGGVAAAKHEPGVGPRSLIALRKEAHLKPQGDGSYAFDGPSFHATVLPDGRVTFDDKIHDLNSFVERKLVGVQINTAEKRRFMESTAALRDQLADAAEVQNQRHAAVTLQSTLRALLADAKLTLAQKRAAIFGLWDDCAGDASGSAAQTAIESFVRTQLPEGSPLAYSTADLSQLNRRRASRRTFDPYGAADAGVRPG